jgi:hypothetical protein
MRRRLKGYIVRTKDVDGSYLYSGDIWISPDLGYQLVSNRHFAKVFTTMEAARAERRTMRATAQVVAVYTHVKDKAAEEREVCAQIADAYGAHAAAADIRARGCK